MTFGGSVAGEPPKMVSVEAVPSTPQVADLVAKSTAVCFFQQMRALTKQEIETRKKYAREGAGIINLREMNELQQELRFDDEEVVRLVVELKHEGRGPLECNSHLVQKTALCFGLKHSEWPLLEGLDDAKAERLCAKPEMGQAVELVRTAGDLEKAEFWDAAPQAILNLSYLVDDALIIARSAEACIGTSLPRSHSPKKAKVSGRKDRLEADRWFALLDTLAREALAELMILGEAPRPCTDPLVKQALTCELGNGNRECRSTAVQAVLMKFKR
jgi:hypothetical protein